MINIPPRNIFSLKDAFTKCYHIINKSLWAATTLSGLKNYQSLPHNLHFMYSIHNGTKSVRSWPTKYVEPLPQKSIMLLTGLCQSSVLG